MTLSIAPFPSDLPTSLALAEEALGARLAPGEQLADLLPPMASAIRTGRANGGLLRSEGTTEGIVVWVPAGPIGVALRLLHLTPRFATLERYRDAFDLVLVAYFQVSLELLALVLARAAAALAPGGTLFVIGHDLTNLTEGVGGPQDPGVLYTSEAVSADLPGLRILRAEQVYRIVERDDGPATAIDTLVRAVRGA